MNEKNDLELLQFIEQKLIDAKDFDSFNFNSFTNIGFKNLSHFNILANILIDFGIAKQIKGKGLRPDFVIISKTDLTGFKKVQDFLDKQKEIDLNETINSENLRLTNDSLKHEQKIREQKQKITDLTEENLTLQNSKLKREIFIAIISFVLGLIVNHYKDYLFQYLPENQQQQKQSNENYRDTKYHEQTSLIPNQKDTNTKTKNYSTTNK